MSGHKTYAKLSELKLPNLGPDHHLMGPSLSLLHLMKGDYLWAAGEEAGKGMLKRWKLSHQGSGAGKMMAKVPQSRP